MSRSDSSRWVTYTALAVGGCAVGAGLLYYAYSRRSSEEQAGPDDSNASQPQATKSAQDRTPVVASSDNSVHEASTSGQDSSVPSCDYCASSGAHLMRCSRCKQASYCSVDCQRKAWPTHKHACKQLRRQPSCSSPPNGSAAPSASASPLKDTPSTVKTPLVESRNGSLQNRNGSETASANGNGTAPHAPSTTASENGTAPSPDQDLTAAVRQYLGQETSSKEDSIDNLFETAFFHFVRTEYRLAITEFTQAQALAKAAGRKDMQGECCKWLGHCYNKLADLSSATRSFLAGHELGKAMGKHKLIVDCLSGLGCMYRTQNDTENALKYLNQALETAQQADDIECTASVECNLGATLMRVDVPSAVAHLRRAVAQREAQVEALHSRGETTALATAIMEHAAAGMNLAGALVAQREHAQAEEAFAQALKVFEMVEDVDKVVKVLINLANLTELEMASDPYARERALEYRSKLFQYVAIHQQREPSDICSICLEELDVGRVSPVGNPVIVLACFHCLHNNCWQQWAHEACPTCKQPVSLV